MVGTLFSERTQAVRFLQQLFRYPPCRGNSAGYRVFYVGNLWKSWLYANSSLYFGYRAYRHTYSAQKQYWAINVFPLIKTVPFANLRNRLFYIRCFDIRIKRTDCCRIHQDVWFQPPFPSIPFQYARV